MKRLRFAYCSHWKILLASVLYTDGPVLELGAGWGSTPLLHLGCEGRRLLTVESHKKWIRQFGALTTDSHQFSLVTDFMTDLDIYKESWGLVFVDQAPDEARQFSILKLRATTQVFVLHDSNQTNHQQFLLEANFKYRYDYTKQTPHTSVFSDMVNVALWSKDLIEFL